MGASGVADLGGIEARLAALPERVNGDVVLLRRGRYLNTICQLDFGGASVLLRIVDGRIAEVQRNPSVMPSADFAIIGEPARIRLELSGTAPMEVSIRKAEPRRLQPGESWAADL